MTECYLFLLRIFVPLTRAASLQEEETFELLLVSNTIVLFQTSRQNLEECLIQPLSKGITLWADF